MDGFALITLVGDGVLENGGEISEIIKELFISGVNAEFIIKLPLQKSIVVGVRQWDYEKAISELYSSASRIN